MNDSDSSEAQHSYGQVVDLYKAPHAPHAATAPFVSLNRHELTLIFSVYGRKVAQGEWRDYAIDMLRDRAVFSVFRRSAEHALYRIEKNPKLARKQGAFSVIAASGLILKRGHDLARVLRVLDSDSQFVILR